MIRGAQKSGSKRVRVHILLDGRDVPDGSSVADTERLEKVQPILPMHRQCSDSRGWSEAQSSEGSSTPTVVPPTQVLEEVRAAGCDAQIASGGGRMYLTMDRYEVRARLSRRSHSSG